MPILESGTDVLLFWAFIGYMLGAIPFGVIVTRALGLGDLRQVGSGNIGATNVLRTGNKGAAALTLLLDAGKGAAAVLLARAFAAEDAAQVAGLGAFLGHLYPAWLAFRGGKGVATFFGVFLALTWQIGLGLLAVWLLVAAVFRFSSLAALTSVGLLPVLVLMFDQSVFLLGLIVTVLIYVKHSANIRRLRAGTETKIGSAS